MKGTIKRKLLAAAMTFAMVFAMMPMMEQPAHAELSTIELDGGSYTMTEDNKLVKDGVTGNEISILSGQNITFTGNTVIKLNGHKLKCNSIKSGFEKPNDINSAIHPWYSYNLTIDGGDKGGSIHIGDSDMNDYAVAANDLTIRNLSADSSVSCLREKGNKVAIFAKNDLRIEGIKKNLDICGAIGTEAYNGETNISDVSGWIVVDAGRNGISTDRKDINISMSKVAIEVDTWDGNCINPAWKKGITITDSIVSMANSKGGEPITGSYGGFNALSASGIVDIKDSCVTAENNHKDRPAMLVYDDTGKLIIRGESLLGCQNVEGGSASALMANAIELKDDNRLYMPKDGSIGKTTYDGGSGEKEIYTVFDKNEKTSDNVVFGSGKEVIHTVSAPSKVLPDRPIHLSGVLKDKDGDPVPNALLWIEYEDTFSEEVMTNAQGIWEYTGDKFTSSDPGEVKLEIHFGGVYYGEESPVKGYVSYLPPPESPCVKVQVISEGNVETLDKLELTDPPKGESRKTEYKCGERFDPNAAYVKAFITISYAKGGISREQRDLEPSGTILTPAVLKHGADKVNIIYFFEGKMDSIDCPVTVRHDWKEATCTEPKTCKGCGTKEGEPLGHDHSVEVRGTAKEATCIEYGKKADIKCSRCDDVKKGEKVDKKGHTWNKGVVKKKATTTKTGKKLFTCKICKTTKTETIPKLVKKANTMKVKGKTAKVKYKKLKKKNQALAAAKVITVTSPKGKLKYKKVSVTYTKAKSVKMSKKALKKYKKKVAKKVNINAKTGKVTVKKGLKKGVYKMKVKVKAAGNANYNPSVWKTVILKIKVK